MTTTPPPAPPAGTPLQAVFDRDLERFNGWFHAAGAVVTHDDGTRGIDPAKAPADLVRAYRKLICFGAANGLLPTGPAAPSEAAG